MPAVQPGPALPTLGGLGMALINPPVFDLLLHFQLAPAQHKLPFASSASLQIPIPLHSALSSGGMLLSLGTCPSLSLATSKQGVMSITKGSALLWAASAQPHFKPRWDSPRCVHHLRTLNSYIKPKYNLEAWCLSTATQMFCQLHSPT